MSAAVALLDWLRHPKMKEALDEAGLIDPQEQINHQTLARNVTQIFHQLHLRSALPEQKKIREQLITSMMSSSIDASHHEDDNIGEVDDDSDHDLRAFRRFLRQIGLTLHYVSKG